MTEKRVVPDDLDQDKLRVAARILGTTDPGETVNAALAEVIRHKRMEFVAELGELDLSPENMRGAWRD